MSHVRRRPTRSALLFMGDDAQLITRHWGQLCPDLERSYYGHPAIRRHVYRSLTGSEPPDELGRGWFEEWAVETFLGDRAPVADCLSLCCGFGEVERVLYRAGAFSHCVAIDIAPDAIAQARQAAAGEGLESVIDYRVGDLDTDELAPESADLVWSNGALHHLSNLEHVLEQVYRALRPGGMLIANEYVGAPHQQLSHRHRELVNAAIHILPPRLRSHRESTFVPSSLQGPRLRTRLFQAAFARLDEERLSGPARRVYAPYWRAAERLRRRRFRFGKVWDVNPWYYSHVDPSEGVRANEIGSLVHRVFPKIAVRPYYGSLLHYALDDRFFDRFDDTSERDRRVLDTLAELERGLVEAGELASDHAVIVARKGGSP